MTPIDYWFSDFQYNWKKFFSKKRNVLAFLLGISYFVFVTFLFKFHLLELEEVKGVQLTDYLLQLIPSRDVSFLIFMILYFTVFYTYMFLLAYPKVLQIFIVFYATALLLRFIMLYVVHLEAPFGMIILSDPILSSSTYSGLHITKDLFFSGHMVAVLCSYFTIPNKFLKLVFLVTSVLTALLLVVQHIHYVIDLLGAIIMVYLLYRIYFRKQWLNSKYSYQYSPQIINIE